MLLKINQTKKTMDRIKREYVFKIFSQTITRIIQKTKMDKIVKNKINLFGEAIHRKNNKRPNRKINSKLQVFYFFLFKVRAQIN